MTGEQRTTISDADASRSSTGMTREETVAFFKRREEAYEDLDAASLAADYAANAVIESPTTGVHSARDAKKALGVIFDAFLDLTIVVDNLVIDGDRVVTFLSIEGTHMREFLGLEPTGKQFKIAAAFVYQLKDRKIVQERRVYDFTGLLLQIGVLKAKPA